MMSEQLLEDQHVCFQCSVCGQDGGFLSLLFSLVTAVNTDTAEQKEDYSVRTQVHSTENLTVMLLHPLLPPPECGKL